GQLGLWRESRAVWDTRLSAASVIVGPLLRHIQLAIQQGMAQRTRIAQKHADLAALHFATRAPARRAHARRVLPFFEKAGLVEDQHAVGVPQMLDDVAA